MLSQAHKRWAYAVLALLFASGVAHFVLHQFFLRQGDFGPTPNPAEPWLLKLHGAMAMAALVLIGSLLQPHVARFWALGRNHRAGAAFLGAMLLLVLSGYALYYLGSETLRPLARWAHIVIGLLALPAFLLHLLRGLRRSKPA